MEAPVEALSGRVVGLWRYPVSSLSGEALSVALLGQDGIDGDRRYGVFDAESQAVIYPVRDRRFNDAPLVCARLDAGGALELSTNGRDWAAFGAAGIAPGLDSVFGRPVEIRRYGTGTAMGVATSRYERSPIHLLSRQAMRSLSGLLPRSVIDERRFRPNIVVDLPEAAAEIPEYGLIGREFRIGNLRLKGVLPCLRCGFTMLRQTALPEDPEILRTLVRRFERKFGIYCEVLDEGPIALGDVLE